MPNSNRLGLAAAGFLMQMALGAVYAWSVFRVPLAKQFHWSIEEVTLTFTASIFVLGVSAFFGGLWLNKKGPRVVALTGGFLYGLGVFLASFSANKLWWLYLSYGFIGGLGLGFGYIVPVATLVKWFPDRRCPAHVRISRRCLFYHRAGRRIVHAKSTGRLAARRLDAERHANGATR